MNMGQNIPIALLFEPLPFILHKNDLTPSWKTPQYWPILAEKMPPQGSVSNTSIGIKNNLQVSPQQPPGELSVQQSQNFYRNPPNCPDNRNKNEIMAEFYNWETVRIKEKTF